MAAKIIDGKQIAAEVQGELGERIQRLRARGVTPGLAVVLVGEDPASISYVTAKERACERLGIYSSDNRLPSDTSEQDLLNLISQLNADPQIHGILVQLPLPKHIDSGRVIAAIDPAKDVDGFHPVSMGNMLLGLPGFIPCTPHGVLVMLEKTGVKTEGAEVVVLGRSNIVGKPLAALLSQKRPNGNATVTVCHTRTQNLGEHTRRADILIAAAGSPGMVTGDMIKPGAVVIDVGVNRVDAPDTSKGYRLQGDVMYEEALKVASAITPVPGGVGPMTITMLLFNTVESAERV